MLTRVRALCQWNARCALILLIPPLLGCADPEHNEPDPAENLGPPGDPIVMDDLESCEGTPYDVAFDQVVPGGDSAAKIVEEFEGSYTSQLVWPAASGPVEHNLASGPVDIELTFDFSERPDKVRWIESHLCDGMTSCIRNCFSRIEIPATLRISSEDGKFAEELAVTVAATKHGIHVVQQAGLAELQGSISQEPITLDPDWTFLQYQIQTEVAYEEQVRGRLLLAVADPNGLLWFNAVGVWPPP